MRGLRRPVSFQLGLLCNSRLQPEQTGAARAGHSTTAAPQGGWLWVLGGHCAHKRRGPRLHQDARPAQRLLGRRSAGCRKLELPWQSPQHAPLPPSFVSAPPSLAVPSPPSHTSTPLDVLPKIPKEKRGGRGTPQAPIPACRVGTVPAPDPGALPQPGDSVPAVTRSPCPPPAATSSTTCGFLHVRKPPAAPSTLRQHQV